MGLGIGIYCERCGGQLSYDEAPFDEENKVCGKCVKEIKKKQWDEQHPGTIREIEKL